MEDFLVAVLTAIMALGGTALLNSFVLGLFVKDEDIKIGTIIIFSIIILLVMLFGMDDLNKLGVIVGTVITVILASLINGGGSGGNNGNSSSGGNSN
ncbi:MAG: hypothetical protein IJM55_04980 [Ruminococcus sp.]|nr:hypothetical protein [Ruminococcus sp.]